MALVTRKTVPLGLIMQMPNKIFLLLFLSSQVFAQNFNIIKDADDFENSITVRTVNFLYEPSPDFWTMDFTMTKKFDAKATYFAIFGYIGDDMIQIDNARLKTRILVNETVYEYEAFGETTVTKDLKYKTFVIMAIPFTDVDRMAKASKLKVRLDFLYKRKDFVWQELQFAQIQSFLTEALEIEKLGK